MGRPSFFEKFFTIYPMLRVFEVGTIVRENECTAKGGGNVAKSKEKAPAKREKTGDPNRGANGRFLPGNNANPRGRAPLPPDFKDYAKEAPARLRAICDDPDTPVKVKADIERWFAEMWYGKSPQALDLDGKLEQTGTQTIKFEGVLDEWSQ